MRTLFGAPSWRKEHPPRGEGGPRRGDLQAESVGPPWRPLGPRGGKGLGMRGAPAPALQRRNRGCARRAGPRQGADMGQGGGKDGVPQAPPGRRVGRFAFPPLQTQGSRPTRGGGGQSKPDVGAAQKMLIILTRKSPGQRNNEVTGAMGAGGDHRHEGATCVPCRQLAALGSLRLPWGVRLHMRGKAPPGGAGGALGRRPRLWATLPFLPGCRAP